MLLSVNRQNYFEGSWQGGGEKYAAATAAQKSSDSGTRAAPQRLAAKRATGFRR